MYARHEVPDVFLFFLDAERGFFGVGDALFVDNLAPVALLHFHLILHARVVLHLGNLRRADKAFLKVRAAPEHCGVIGRWVILATNGWKSKQQGEFALLCPFAAKAIRAWLSAHKRSEVAERVGFVEERHALYFVGAGRTVLPIPIIYIWYMPTAVCPPEPHVARFLMHDAVNLRAVLGENNHAHGKKVVLYVRNLFEEKRIERIAPRPFQRVDVLGALARGFVLELDARAVTSKDVKKLILRRHFVRTYQFLDLVRQLIVHAERRIGFLRPPRHGLKLYSVIVEHARSVFHGRNGGLHAVLRYVYEFYHIYFLFVFIFAARLPDLPEYPGEGAARSGLSRLNEAQRPASVCVGYGNARACRL